MKAGVRKFGTADRRLLPEGRLAGPMPWVIAIMTFLTVLAASAGMGLGHAARSLDGDLAGRVTVQVLQADSQAREAEARAALDALTALPGVARAVRADQRELERLLEPWLGRGGLAGDIPIPAMIDVTLDPAQPSAPAEMRQALRAVAPSARVDDNAAWLAPLTGLIRSLEWLSAALVALMVAASAATVVLAARAAIDTHRATIEVLHLMGATDVQIARLFQRRIALDALFGGIVGLVAAVLVIALLGSNVSAIGSELLGSVALPLWAWAILLVLPLTGVAVAMLVARVTILRALGRML